MIQQQSQTKGHRSRCSVFRPLCPVTQALPLGDLACGEPPNAGHSNIKEPLGTMEYACSDPDYRPDQ